MINHYLQLKHSLFILCYRISPSPDTRHPTHIDTGRSLFHIWCQFHWAFHFIEFIAYNHHFILKFVIMFSFSFLRFVLYFFFLDSIIKCSVKRFCLRNENIKGKKREKLVWHLVTYQKIKTIYHGSWIEGNYYHFILHCFKCSHSIVGEANDYFVEIFLGLWFH